MTDQTITTSVHQDKIIKGAAFALIAFLCFALTNAFAKLLSDTHHVIELVFYRNLIVFVPFMLFILIFKKYEIFKTKKPVAILSRALMATACLGVTFTAYKILPMADATVLLFAASLTCPVLGFIFLKERIGPFRWAAVIIGFGGVAYMAQPSGQMLLIGVIAGLVAAFMQAVMMTIARHIKTERPITATFYLFAVGTIVTGLAFPFVWQPFVMGQLPLFIGMGVTGGIAQLCIVHAFKYAPAAIVSTLNYTGIIWACGLDILIWQTIPAAHVLIGAAIIIGANLFILHREHIHAKR